MEEAEDALKRLDPTKVEDVGKFDFYRSQKICCEGILTYIMRNGEKASELAKKETDETRKKELEQIAEDCSWLCKNPPKTFRQAIQLVLFHHNAMFFDTNGSAISFGRFDQYLYPFYKNDIESGAISDEEVQELLDCFWIKIADNNWLLNKSWAQYSAGYMPYQNLCVGGITPEGYDAVNELSYMVLQTCMNVRTHQPSLTVRLNKKNPQKFIRKICKVARLGMGMPGIHNDEIGIKTAMKKNVLPWESRDWIPTGCVEPQVGGKTFQWNEVAQYAFPHTVEFAIHNGRSLILDGPYGLETGPMESYETFEDFYDAVKQQQANLIRHASIANNVLELIHRDEFPCPVISLGYIGTMESGKDILWGGAKYSVGNVVMGIGLADAVDSLAAVKKLVFDEGKISKKDLREALVNNFVGYDNIRNMLINDAPKYGNGIMEVDKYAQELVDLHISELEKYETLHGGCLRGATYSASANVPQGLSVAALPSGRYATQPVADGVSPFRGYDKHGPTTVLESVGVINQEDIDGGSLLNMKLDPSIVADEEGLQRFMSFVNAFLDTNIFQIQFNVVSTEVLLEAQKKPDDYEWLIVRVAGYSAHFVSLNKDSQMDIINRTLNKAL
jgi:formate C-acetyltransferase